MSARLSQGFVFLQLSMVDRFVAIGAGSWADGAHRLTNLQRRLGLGTPTDPPSTRSYASLFPPTHLAGAVVRRGRSTFRGMSHWGQFVDHRGDVKTDLAERFLERVGTWAGDDPCRLFPIETLEVRSPLSHFLVR